MVVMIHELIHRHGDAVLPVVIRLDVPIPADRSWSCAYEIGWPEGPRRSVAHGGDALQALTLALQKIGTELYTSVHHRSGALSGSSPGGGYGFPVPPNLRDLLAGDDVAAFG